MKVEVEWCDIDEAFLYYSTVDGLTRGPFFIHGLMADIGAMLWPYQPIKRSIPISWYHRGITETW